MLFGKKEVKTPIGGKVSFRTNNLLDEQVMDKFAKVLEKLSPHEILQYLDKIIADKNI